MRTREDLQNIIFSDWTRLEIARASIEALYPPDEETRLFNLRAVLPALDAQLQEEQKAFLDVKANTPNSGYLREWKKDLAVLEGIVKQGIELGMKHDLWHARGAKCPKCDALLQRIERVICSKCCNGTSVARPPSW
jgi:hypothetical protein